ncbi:hypothetical protein ACFSSC_10930 [Corynebacterium mendelii]|uniref:DUF4259 domain-containing protein n=1 Tax=Corynebacterium mendelii TaxID=2765362 RepID=A0A939E123_9CORY|nr:hypothetical protein [Corynebacterium mendelii]MBN9644474.1 hypothetical protein [Corynebacterium mendelii]
MEPWDLMIFNEDTSQDFFDELADLDGEEIVEAVADACALVTRDPNITDDDLLIGRAAATIAAIWAGAPYTAGEVVEDYPFIRELIGHGEEQMFTDACDILEAVEVEADLDSFIEALSSADVG